MARLRPRLISPDPGLAGRRRHVISPDAALFLVLSGEGPSWPGSSSG